MNDAKRYFLTTAIDYPNSRPHIGTAFEKIGADVQARYRRMEGYDVFFLMGNDENTVKVSKRAAELGQEPRRTATTWPASSRKSGGRSTSASTISCRPASRAIMRVAGSSSRRCTTTATSTRATTKAGIARAARRSRPRTEVKEANGLCPDPQDAADLRRSEPCYFFALSKFQERLLDVLRGESRFHSAGESRATRSSTLVKTELHDVNITRTGENWGIRVPFDPEFTIYVWFDALLTYITGIGYGADEATFSKWWPADMHFIGKDITRFHCALWPAMLLAAGIEPPQRGVRARLRLHQERRRSVRRSARSLGNVVEPMDVITKFSARGVPLLLPARVPVSRRRRVQLGAVHRRRTTRDLANNLGNLYSRVVTLITTELRRHAGRNRWADADAECRVTRI